MVSGDVVASGTGIKTVGAIFFGAKEIESVGVKEIEIRSDEGEGGIEYRQR